MDSPIKEPFPFDTEIFSEKLNGPGYKYEIRVCVRTGHIVWINGPFKAGCHDTRVFKECGLKAALCDNECVEVDAGFQGDDRYKNPNISQSRKDRKEKSVVRARHKNVNGRLKQSNVLNDVFCHNSAEKHQLCAFAVAVTTQLGFELDEGLYDVKYNPNYN